MCRPISALDVASNSSGDNFVSLENVPAHLRPKKPKKPLNETAAPVKLSGQMERCIQNVKANLRKKNSTFKDQSIKSAAIAICRSRLKQ